MEGLNLGEGVDCTHLENDLKALRGRYDQLQGEVEELISNMETGSSIVGQFQVRKTMNRCYLKFVLLAFRCDREY